MTETNAAGSARDCPICRQGTPQDVIAEGGAVWVTAQSVAPLPGYVCIVSKEHVREPYELAEAGRVAFWREVDAVARAIDQALRPAKLNYEIHGNTIEHLHLHLFPRVPSDRFEGRPIDPRQTAYRSPVEIDRIRAAVAAALHDPAFAPGRSRHSRAPVETVEDDPFGEAVTERRWRLDTRTDSDSGLSDVVRYYAAAGEREWGRLAEESPGRIEFEVTIAVLERNLPPQSRVLDLGGGPGRYAAWLHEHGHRVTLADVSPAMLELAQARLADLPGIEIVPADARDLSRWPDESFDAVVALGPFYHLVEEAERRRALEEISRVLPSNGLLVAAVMPRFAFIRRTLAVPDERRHLAEASWVRRVVDEGIFVNDIAGRFTSGYGFRVDAIRPFFESGGFRTLEVVAAEGFIPGVEAGLVAAKTMEPAAYHAAVELAIATAGDPSILGMASHVLYVGTRTTT